MEINPVASRMAGSSRMAILGKPLEQAWLELDQLVSQPYWGNNIETYLRSSGRLLYYEISLTPIRDKNGSLSGKLVILRDLSERMKMQQQLIAQDRLASIGELTSGIAHELNNPLSIISGYSELLSKRELPDDIESDLKQLKVGMSVTVKVRSSGIEEWKKRPEVTSQSSD